MMLSYSKLRMYETKIDFLGFESIGLNHLYRARELFRALKLAMSKHITKKQKFQIQTNQDESDSYPACCIKICDYR